MSLALRDLEPWSTALVSWTPPFVSNDVAVYVTVGFVLSWVLQVIARIVWFIVSNIQVGLFSFNMNANVPPPSDVPQEHGQDRPVGDVFICSSVTESAFRKKKTTVLYYHVDPECGSLCTNQHTTVGKCPRSKCQHYELEVQE